jgi:hypothetical protein
MGTKKINNEYDSILDNSKEPFLGYIHVRVNLGFLSNRTSI